LKWITHPAAVALGISTLSTLSLPGPLISNSHDAVYHLRGSALAIFLPVALNICVLWILLAVILRLAERSARLNALVWRILFVSLPWVLLKNWVSLLNLKLSEGVAGLVLVIPAAAVLGVALWRPGTTAIRHRAQGFAASVLGFASLAGVVVLGQLFWFGWQARSLNSAPQLHQRGSVSAARPHSRVIWIVLDELSFQQVYERRFPGLRLAAFDRLAETATVFTHVVPAGNMTALVLPSLITGFDVDRLKLTANGELRSLHDPTSGVWRSFDPSQTVFQDALNAGYGTAVAGWYNPYCRILPQVLDRCFWTFRVLHPGHLSSDRSIAANLAAPYLGFAAATWQYLFPHQVPSLLERNESALQIQTTMHIDDDRDLISAADALLTDPSSGFILLHLPVPHPGGIYDRSRGTFTTVKSSYIDNLALADQSLAHIRQVLEQRGEWDSSAILVMGDHSWRTQLEWVGSPEWTPEDEVASHGGQFDDRPAYVVKLPGQHAPARIDQPFAATRTRALLDAILAGRMHTSDNLRAWVEQQQHAASSAIQAPPQK
jgi:Sulfatase